MTQLTEEGRVIRCKKTLNHNGKVIPLYEEYVVTDTEHIYDDKNDHVIVDEIITIEHTDSSEVSDKICTEAELHFDKLIEFFDGVGYTNL